MPADFYIKLGIEPTPVIVTGDLSTQLFVANQAALQAQGKPFCNIVATENKPLRLRESPTPLKDDPTYQPYHVFVRVVQAHPAGSPTRAMSSLVFGLHGPTDRGQHAMITASRGWQVERTWVAKPADMPAARDYYRKPGLVARDIKMFDLTGRDGEDIFEDGKTMALWVTFAEDPASLGPEDGPPRVVAVSIASPHYIRQPMWLTPPVGWKVTGPIDGRTGADVKAVLDAMPREHRLLLREWRKARHPPGLGDDEDKDDEIFGPNIPNECKIIPFDSDSDSDSDGYDWDKILEKSRASLEKQGLSQALSPTRKG